MALGMCECSQINGVPMLTCAQRRHRTGFTATDDILNRIVRSKWIISGIMMIVRSDGDAKQSCGAEWFNHFHLGYSGSCAVSDSCKSF